MSLRQMAKELGVSHSYLSQVIHGKRPASEKVLTMLTDNGLLTTTLLKVKDLRYNETAKMPSCVAVAQRTLNPFAEVRTLARQPIY
jgi:transcriptional regulator with XRE-family HTH domain